MTSAEFVAIIAELEDEGIAVTKFRGLNDEYPRMVWQPGRIEQSYASNKACDQRTTIVAEYMTKDDPDPNFEIIKTTFREAELPFVCEIGYDEEKDVISYLFNMSLSEVI